jgi:hypothetical protein
VAPPGSARGVPVLPPGGHERDRRAGTRCGRREVAQPVAGTSAASVRNKVRSAGMSAADEWGEARPAGVGAAGGWEEGAPGVNG